MNDSYLGTYTRDLDDVTIRKVKENRILAVESADTGGNAKIELRRIGTDEVLSFELDGDKPSFVDMPIWYTHNITNIGNEELYTIFWINEHYDADDSDTYFEKV